ncbi:MAG: hypothetical protein MHM6MM_005698 [Cercozoa sp. M6MM]
MAASALKVLWSDASAVEALKFRIASFDDASVAQLQEFESRTSEIDGVSSWYYESELLYNFVCWKIKVDPSARTEFSDYLPEKPLLFAALLEAGVELSGFLTEWEHFMAPVHAFAMSLAALVRQRAPFHEVSRFLRSPLLPCGDVVPLSSIEVHDVVVQDLFVKYIGVDLECAGHACQQLQLACERHGTEVHDAVAETAAGSYIHQETPEFVTQTVSIWPKDAAELIQLSRDQRTRHKLFSERLSIRARCDIGNDVAFRLWPSAFLLLEIALAFNEGKLQELRQAMGRSAECLLTSSDPNVHEEHILELGGGVGFAACALQRLCRRQRRHITTTDYEASVRDLARENAVDNGVADGITCDVLDWTDPERDTLLRVDICINVCVLGCICMQRRQWSCLVATDVVYLPEVFPALIDTTVSALRHGKPHISMLLVSEKRSETYDDFVALLDDHADLVRRRFCVRRDGFDDSSETDGADADLTVLTVPKRTWYTRMADFAIDVITLAPHVACHAVN